uniref:Uncharacterized protein At2g41400 n=1 Tax=Arabidopsis thaliana TaxID=3702 RepID=Q9ZVC5_ARATH|nr:unknown protein [Arabidopsis thaliana]
MASLFYISHAFKLWSYTIDRVSIRGVVYCSLDGDPSAPPVSNATVYIECPGSNSTLAQAVTNQLRRHNISQPWLMFIANYAIGDLLDNDV